MPKFVKYTHIGDGDGAGIKYGDVLKVLTYGRFHPTYLYVETPIQSKYYGSSAMNENKLKGKNFTYLADYEYEIVKEEKKVETEHKFKVGDIVCGNGKDNGRYDTTNKNMTKAKVIKVYSNGHFGVKILEHVNETYIDETLGMYFETSLNPEYFDLVEDKPTPNALYHITTDMKTFVDIEHNGNKGWSKCDARYDKFDIHIGVDLALERLDKIENPPVPEPVKELPKYVRYIGKGVGDGGLKHGDICRVLSGVIKGATTYDDTLFVASPSPTRYNNANYNNANASNPSALTGVNFTYLWPDKYEIVDFNIHD